MQVMSFFLLSEFLTTFSTWSRYESTNHSQNSNFLQNFILWLTKLFYAKSCVGFTEIICTASTCRWQNSGPKLFNIDYTYR